MSPPKVLVIGGAGYIGSHTTLALAQAGYEPLILDNFSNSHPQIYKGIQKILGYAPLLYKGDACNPSLVAQIFKKHAPLRGIIHFAALKSIEKSLKEPLPYYRNNLASLWTVLEAKPPQVVFSSSCTVYGKPKVLPVEENMPLAPPSSPYGYTKQISEQMLADSCRGQGIRGISLRYFNPIGAHPSAHIGELPLGPAENLMVALARAAHQGHIFHIHGNNYKTPDGSCIRDYLHVMDLAEAHVAALNWLEKQPKGSYEVLNCGTGKGHSVLEIVQAFEKLSQIKVKKEIGPRRAGDFSEIYAKVDKATQILKWQAQRSLDTAIKDAWRWQQTLPKVS